MLISLLFTGIQYIRDDSFYNGSLLNSKVFRKNQLKYRNYTGKWINCINVEFRAGMEKSNNAGKWLGKKRIKKFVKKCCFNCFNFDDAMGHKKVKLADAGFKTTPQRLQRIFRFIHLSWRISFFCTMVKGHDILAKWHSLQFLATWKRQIFLFSFYIVLITFFCVTFFCMMLKNGHKTLKT